MSKLLDALKSLSAKEMQGLARFIDSSDHCQHAETIRLFEFLAPYYPDFHLDVYDEFARSLPDRPLPRPRFNVLKSYLLGYVYEFLVHEKLQARPVMRQILLTESLLDRGLFREAEKQLESAQRHLETEAWIDSQNMTDQLTVKELQLDLAFSREMRSGAVPLLEVFDLLDQHQLTLGLKYLLPALTFHHMFGQAFPQERWEELSAQVREAPDAVPPLARMYYHSLALLHGGERQEHLPPLRNLLDQHAGRMSQPELINVYGYLQNYLTHQVQSGVPGALEELFEVFQQLEYHDILFGRGEFSEHILRNITITGCRLGELAWVQQFLKNHRSRIEEGMGQGTLAYSLAYLSFYQGNYAGALLHLQDLEFVDAFYRTGHQVLLLRIYYEMDDFVSLEALAQTFRRYLNRTTSLSEAKKDLGRRFISVLRKLVEAREKGVTRSRLDRIRERMAAGEEMTDRTWLKAKLEELERQLSGQGG